MAQPLRKETAAPMILIVDDEKSICDTLAGVLSDEGYNTMTALSGPEAIEKAAQSKPELVFLDIWMPGLDGIATLRRLKEVSPNSQVVMISGHATIATALESTRLGAADFIEKPLSIDNVLIAVSRALARHQNPDQEGAEKLLFSHPTAFSTGLRGKNIGQRTIKEEKILYGQGLHSGQRSGLILEPLPLNSGIHFSTIGDFNTVPASVEFVHSTGFATTLRSKTFSVSTIEHLMSALHAFRITNLLIKCNGEVPILDGSALEFCKIIGEAGIEEQGGEWFEISPSEPITFEGEGRGGLKERITISPAEELEIDYQLHYPAPVGSQSFTYRYQGPQSFIDEISKARTFGFLKDIERLQKAGLAAGGRLDNFVLVGEEKIVNTELRYPEELPRHKILDAMGDLFLLGRPLRARIEAVMTGHSDNVQVLQKFLPLIHGE